MKGFQPTFDAVRHIRYKSFQSVAPPTIRHSPLNGKELQMTLWIYKLLVRWFSVAILKSPDESLPYRQGNWEILMAFHWCSTSGTYRYDRHVDPISLNEHFICGCCRKRTDTRGSLASGFSFFRLRECLRIVSEHKLSLFQIFRLHFFSIPEKYLPLDRNGKTS